MALLYSSLYARSKPFIFGADISWVQEDEDKGQKYYDNGVQKDIFEILKDHKFNYIRLRTFHNPKASGGYSSAGYCDLEHTKTMATRIKAAGMGFLLDFHYSDNWADPGKQVKPSAWTNLSFEELTQAVHDYTEEVINQLKNQDTAPDMVQIGNEINPGMMLPDGSTDNFDNLATLIKAGISGVKVVDQSIKIVLHLAAGDDLNLSTWWVDNILARDVVFDILGESCYAEYHGPPSGWQNTFDGLVDKYPDLDFIIAEYSEYKREANDIMFNLPDDKGLGTFIWEPTRWAEACFSYSGYTNEHIDLYPQMAAEYAAATPIIEMTDKKSREQPYVLFDRRIYNLHGRLVRCIPGKSIYSIQNLPVKSMAGGIYITEVSTKPGNRSQNSFIKLLLK